MASEARCCWCGAERAAEQVERIRGVEWIEFCPECSDDPDDVPPSPKVPPCAGTLHRPGDPRLPPVRDGWSRWVCISDTHTRHRQIDTLPPGDVLIHAGDFTNTGTVDEVSDFLAWFQELPHPHKVLVAGNHETTLDKQFYSEHWARFHPESKQNPTDIAKCLSETWGVLYLEDAGAVVCGYSVYGSPWQPSYGANEGDQHWGFNLPRGEPLKSKWDAIPDGTDVLVSHGPPAGHGDLIKAPDAGDTDPTAPQRVGCADLAAVVSSRVKPAFHVFGHVHSGYGVTADAGGTRYINAATCTEGYHPTNPPIVFDLPPRSAE